MSPHPTCDAAAAVIDLAQSVVGTAVRHLAATGGPDATRCSPTTSPTPSAQVETARSLLDYGAKGDVEARITCAFTADMVHDLITRLAGREALWGVEPAPLRDAHPFLEHVPRRRSSSPRSPTSPGPRHLDGDFEMVQDTFRSFAENEITPRAEHVHRAQRRRARGDHQRARRDGRVRAQRAGRVRRVQRGRRRRVHGHGRRHRGAEPGLARHRRFADHPARDPHPRARQGRHRGAEAASGCRSWPPPR